VAGLVHQSSLVVWTEAYASSHKHDGWCAICQEAYNSTATPDICRVLECGHVFHQHCVDNWLARATSCPLCKRDLRLSRTTSQRSLGRSSQTSSRSESSLRTGQILVGHSNSDPALLGVLEFPPIIHRASPPTTPDRQWQHHSATSLQFSSSDRSLPILSSSRSERSVGILSSSSSGALPAVQEAWDEARAAEDSQRSHSSNPPSPVTVLPDEAAVAPAEVPSGAAPVHQVTREAVDTHAAPEADGRYAAGSVRLQQASHSVHLPVGCAPPSSGEHTPVGERYGAGSVSLQQTSHSVHLPVGRAATSSGEHTPGTVGDQPAAVRVQLRQACHSVHIPVAPAAGGEEHPSAWPRGRISVYRGHTMPFVIPPTRNRDVPLQESAADRSSERCSSVPPPVLQPSSTIGTDDKMSASVRSVCIVPTPPSSTASAASAPSTTPAASATPPVLASGAVATVLGTRVVQGPPSFPVVHSTTTYRSTGLLHSNGTVSQPSSSWCAYGVTRPILSQVTQQTQCSSRSFSSLRG